MTRKPGLGGLLLLGAAAFGVYKYTKMSDQEKRDLMDKGRKFVDENLGSIKNIFGQKGDTQAAVSTPGQNGFSEG